MNIDENKIIKLFKSFLIIRKIKKLIKIRFMTNPLSIPQSKVLILKKPNIKRIGTCNFLFSKKNENNMSENIIGISLATRWSTLAIL